jgi:hypothetical protein
MSGTESFHLVPPTEDDLSTAQSAWDAGTIRYTLGPNDVWWRVLKASSSDEAREYASTWYASRSIGRFTPIYDKSAIVPSAYAGSTRATSLWEVILRNVRHEGIRRVSEHEVRDRYLVGVTAHRPLHLLDMRRPLDAHLVASGKRPPDLTAAWPKGYPLTSLWAQALRARIPALDGVLYESHQIRTACAVFYQRPGATGPLFDVHNTPRSVNSSPVRGLLLKEAQKAGVAVDFGDDPDDNDDPDL